MAIVDVIKWNGAPDTLAWKYPSEELGTWTQMIVAESQEAFLFKGGQPIGPFLAGRHTLDTANYPILGQILKIATGGRSPFTAEVWYVNKGISLDIKWGTPTAIQALDPQYRIMLPVRAYGQLGLQVVDSGKFLVKLVGTLGTSGATDGTGAAALFKNPGAIAADISGNLYVADTANHTIRKIVITGGGVVTTFSLDTTSITGGVVTVTGANTATGGTNTVSGGTVRLGSPAFGRTTDRDRPDPDPGYRGPDGGGRRRDRGTGRLIVCR